MSESAPGRASGSSDASDKEFVCPDCGDTFGSEHGLKVHAGRIHTEHPDEDEPCPDCGEMFADQRAVAIHHSKKHDGSLTGFEYTCDFCSKTTTKDGRVDGKVFCDQECYGDWMSENWEGTDHPSWSGVILECEWCGAPNPVSKYRKASSKYCSRDCKDAALTEQTQESHPRWTGGHPRHYSGKWQRKRRERLEIDGHSCVICGKGKEELGRQPSVHHVIPVRTFDDEQDAHTIDNLITLCREHHRAWEGLYLKPDIR